MNNGGTKPNPSNALRRVLDGFLSKLSRGQAMVEFAMVSTVAMFVLLVAIQYAMIGQAALAMSQAAFQGARYASVNPNAAQSDVQTVQRLQRGCLANYRQEQRHLHQEFHSEPERDSAHVRPGRDRQFSV